MLWQRPGESPVVMHFRDDEHAGFAWQGKLPLARVKPGVDEFAVTEEGVT